MKGVLQDYLVTDSVVASTAQTMEDTLRFLDTRFGGIKEYLRLIGITRSEVRTAVKLEPVLECAAWGACVTHRQKTSLSNVLLQCIPAPRACVITASELPRNRRDMHSNFWDASICCPYQGWPGAQAMT